TSAPGLAAAPACAAALSPSAAATEYPVIFFSILTAMTRVPAVRGMPAPPPACGGGRRVLLARGLARGRLLRGDDGLLRRDRPGRRLRGRGGLRDRLLRRRLPHRLLGDLLFRLPALELLGLGTRTRPGGGQRLLGTRHALADHLLRGSGALADGL